MKASNVIVVDTNVWLDYLFGSRRGNGASKDFFNEAARIPVSLVIAPHSLSDMFFLVQRELKEANRKDGKLSAAEASASARAAAWSVVDFILEIAAVGPSGHMDAIVASKHRQIHSDYEDNLVVACAMRTNARLLVTNDEKLVRHSPVTTLNARDAALMLALET